MITREKLCEGAYFTAIEGDYKRTRLSAFLSAPLSRRTLTATALIPYLLERGTRELPDRVLLSRRLLSLYGASMEADYSQYGYSRVLEAFISGADGALLPDGERVARERVALLGDMLCDPNAPGGAFEEKGVGVEKEKLRETIRSIINDKRDYCFKKLTEKFYEGDDRSLPPDGFEEDLEGLTGERAYGVYRKFLDTCGVELLYSGPNAEDCRAEALELARRINPREQPIKPVEAVPIRDTVETAQTLEVEQDKLALFFTTGRTLDRRDFNALRVGCTLLGGTPTSRLFMNVREKQSLCYYVTCSASYESGGGATVECGVDAKDAARARDAILLELDRLAEKGPTEKEMSELALTYKNIFGGVTDSSSAINSYIFANLQRCGELVTPEMQLEESLSVTREDAMRLLRELHLNCVSRIAAQKGGGR